MFKWLFGRRRVIATRDQLAAFLATEAAFISQKCTFEYCRARSGLNWDKLFKEAAFAEAVEASRWRGFAAVMSDVALVADGRIRALSADTSGAHVPALSRAVAEALDHFDEARTRTDVDWTAEAAAMAERLAQAQLAPPKRAHEIGLRSGAIVFDSLPVHPDIRAYDRELVTNNIRFNLARAAITMEERFAPALVDEMLAGAR